jgi:protein-tyrosine phosphatase
LQREHFLKKVQILFICMGNICRSPTAEGVMRKLVAGAGLQHRVAVDSAGTHGYHVGSPPDARSLAAAGRRGYDLTALRARQVVESDFEEFDLLLVMDLENLMLLQSMCPAQHQAKLRLLMSYALNSSAPVVPDPYYGDGVSGFETVLDYIEDACDGLLRLLSHRSFV